MKATLQGLALLLRVVAGGILAWAGWEKMRAFAWWRDQLGKTELLPEEFVGPFAAGLPGLELLVGIALVLGLWWRAAVGWGMALYLGFAIAMTQMLRDGRLETCACFGPGSDLEVTPQAAFTRAAAAFGLGLLLWRERDPISAERIFSE